uniref:ATP synthase subunit b n=1 Tax=Lilium regale TaxID=82328 RepID=A0A248SMK9_LILRE|nr:ATP synthase subunit b' [Lilium regale]
MIINRPQPPNISRFCPLKSPLLHSIEHLGETRVFPMASTVMVSSSPKLLPAAPSDATRHRRPALLPITTRSAAAPLRRLIGSVTLPVAAALAAAPAMAAEIEKAALFDFNLTLPAIAIEFLLLMVALDKLYFTPLGNFMDKRDAEIRAMLGDVKDTSGEVKQLEEQAAAVLKAARAEIAAALNQMKKETAVELEAKLAEGKKRVEAELAEALAALEAQKEETIKALDSQIAALGDEIVQKVLPVK